MASYGAAAAVQEHGCPYCKEPAGSLCTTRNNEKARRTHSSRIALVPEDRIVLRVWMADPMTLFANKKEGKGKE